MHQLDWLPQYYDLDRLSFHLGISTEQLIKLTFTPIFKKLFVNFEADLDRYHSTLRKELILNRRRFCPRCIDSKGYYKLIWQAQKIEICDEHFIYLEDTCPICGKQQKYASTEMNSNQCCHCGSSLTTHNRKVTNSSYIKEQLRYYSDWDYLNSTHTSLVSNIPGMDNITQRLACLVLYVSRKDKDVLTFECNNTGLFSPNIIKRFAMLVRNPDNSKAKRVILQDIWKVTQVLGMSLLELSEVQIPTSFVKSFFPERFDIDKIGNCISPWCEHYCTNISMKAFGEDRRIMKKRVLYSNMFCCTGCYMKCSWHDNEWIEVDGWVQLIKDKISPLFESGLTRNEVAKEIGCNFNKIRLMRYSVTCSNIEF